jgi:hypothetical protein
LPTGSSSRSGSPKGMVPLVVVQSNQWFDQFSSSSALQYWMRWRWASFIHSSYALNRDIYCYYWILYYLLSVWLYTLRETCGKNNVVAACATKGCKFCTRWMCWTWFNNVYSGMYV